MSTATESAPIDIKRYDRQIRLWGLETQTGLHGARILLLRATGLCNEIAKNLVLAGVGHVSIHDAGVVQQQDIDTGAVFYFSKADIGRGRAEVLAEGLRALNPSVDISVLTEELRDLGADGLRRFSYIIGTHGAGAVRCSPTPLPTARATHPIRHRGRLRTLSRAPTCSRSRRAARPRPARRLASAARRSTRQCSARIPTEQTSCSPCGPPRRCPS